MMNFDKDPPATIPEAIAALEAGLHEKDKAHLVAYGGGAAHHSLGRNIRNGWDLWLDDTPLVQWSKATYGVGHADDISGLILGGLTAALSGATFDFEAEAARYRQHWEATKADGPALPEGFTLFRGANEAPHKRGWLSRIFGDKH